MTGRVGGGLAAEREAIKRVNTIATAYIDGNMQRIGYIAHDLPGWRWLVGMAVVPLGSMKPARFAGFDRGALLLIEDAVDRERLQARLPRSRAVGMPPDLSDHATGCLALGLLCRAMQIGHVALRDQETAEVRLLAVPEVFMRAVPIGIAAVVVAAANGGWDKSARVLA